MNKNDKEIKLLYEWAVQNSLDYHFQGIDQAKESYFDQRMCGDRDSYIREYTFESLPEFMEELDALWGDDMTMNRIKKVVGIAAIKNKGSTDVYKAAENDNGEHSDSIEKLPMYIYNF